MNKRFNALFVGGLVSVVAVSCGKKLDPLTAEQKERFRGSVAQVGSMATAVGKAQEAAKTKGKKTAKISAAGESMLDQVLAGLSQVGSQSRMAAGFGDEESGYAPPSPAAADPGAKPSAKDVKGEEMGAKLSAAVESGDCKISPVEMPNGKNVSQVSIKLTVDGAKCPVNLSLSVSGSGDENNGSVKFSLAFTLNDAEFKKLSDIGAAKINGDMSFNMSESKIGASVSLDGDITSAKEGVLGFYTKGEIDAKGGMSSNPGAEPQGMTGSAEIAFGLKFKDFTGELKVKAEGTGQNVTPEFFVNDQKVDQNEFMSYLGAMGSQVEKFKQGGTNAPAPTPTLAPAPEME